jgi:hypothetical protein
MPLALWLGPLACCPELLTLIRSIRWVPRSHRKMSETAFVSPGTRLDATDSNATNWPPLEMYAMALPPLPGAPVGVRLSRTVEGPDGAGVVGAGAGDREGDGFGFGLGARVEWVAFGAAAWVPFDVGVGAWVPFDAGVGPWVAFGVGACVAFGLVFPASVPIGFEEVLGLVDPGEGEATGEDVPEICVAPSAWSIE